MEGRQPTISCTVPWGLQRGLTKGGGWPYTEAMGGLEGRCLCPGYPLHQWNWVASEHTSKSVSPHVHHVQVSALLGASGCGRVGVSISAVAVSLLGSGAWGIGVFSGALPSGRAWHLSECAHAELRKAEAGGGAWDPTFEPTVQRGRLRLRLGRVRGGSESPPPEAFSCGGKRPPMRAGPVT